MDKIVPAGAFKQGCLAMLDEVAATHRPIVVTKRGRPVARVVPVQDSDEIEAAILRRLKGGARVLVSEAEFLAPTADIAQMISQSVEDTPCRPQS